MMRPTHKILAAAALVGAGVCVGYVLGASKLSKLASDIRVEPKLLEKARFQVDDAKANVGIAGYCARTLDHGADGTRRTRSAQARKHAAEATVQLDQLIRLCSIEWKPECDAHFMNVGVSWAATQDDVQAACK